MLWISWNGTYRSNLEEASESWCHPPSWSMVWAPVFLVEMDLSSLRCSRHLPSWEAWHYPNRWYGWFGSHCPWVLMDALLLMSLSSRTWWTWPPLMSSHPFYVLFPSPSGRRGGGGVYSMNHDDRCHQLWEVVPNCCDRHHFSIFIAMMMEIVFSEYIFCNVTVYVF